MIWQAMIFSRTDLLVNRNSRRPLIMLGFSLLIVLYILTQTALNLLIFIKEVEALRKILT